MVGIIATKTTTIDEYSLKGLMTTRNENILKIASKIISNYSCYLAYGYKIMLQMTWPAAKAGKAKN